MEQLGGYKVLYTVWRVAKQPHILFVLSGTMRSLTLMSIVLHAAAAAAAAAALLLMPR